MTSYLYFEINIIAYSGDGRVDWSAERPSWWPDDVLFSNPSGTPKMTSGHSDLVITAFLEEHAAFFLEEEDIPMESEQIDLNIERASQKHVNPDVKKLMVNVSNSLSWVRIFTLQRT